MGRVSVLSLFCHSKRPDARQCSWEDSVASAALRGIVGDWFRRSNKEVSKAVLDIIERSGKRYLAILGHS